MTTLSACLIVRDEERHLETCLRSLRPWVDEICILDTGSTDGTVELARSLADRVERTEWRADFSAARNECLELARGDWILCVDADEVLDESSGDALRRATGDRADGEDGEGGGPEVQAWLVRVDSVRDRGGYQSTLLPRLFRRRPEIRFSRPVHESVMESLVELGVAALQDSGVRLVHSGYTGEAVARKRVRNLMLLRKRSLEAPDDLYNTYKLACTLRDSEHAAEQLSTFDVVHRRAEELGEPERSQYPFLPLVYEGFAACLVRHGRLGQARSVVERGLELFPECPELLYRSGDLARRSGRDELATRRFESCLAAGGPRPLYAADPGLRDVAPLLGLALVHARRGEAAASREALARVLAIEPDHLEAQCLAMRLRLAGGGSEAAGGIEGTLEALGELLHTHPDAAPTRLLAGEVAAARGDRETALDLWRAAALERDDVGPMARCRVAIAEAATGRLDTARDHLAKLCGRDVEIAGCRAVLAVVSSAPLEVDPGIAAEDLLTRMVPWLRELLEGPSDDAVQAFAANAHLYAATLPGVDSLLVPAEEARAGETPEVAAESGRGQ